MNCEYYLEDDSICSHPAQSNPLCNDLKCSKCTLPRSANNYCSTNKNIESLLAESNHQILSHLLSISPSLSISFNYFTQKLEISFSNEKLFPNPKKNPPKKFSQYRISPTGYPIETIYSDPLYTIELTEPDFSSFDQLTDDPLLNEQLNLELIFDNPEFSNENTPNIPEYLDLSKSIQSISDIDNILSEMRSILISTLKKQPKDQQKTDKK